MILKVELDEQSWQKMIDLLALAPYRDAAPFIAAIAQQFQAQRDASEHTDKVSPIHRSSVDVPKREQKG